jgi:hypothetical protein
LRRESGKMRPPTTLQNTLESLAADFAKNVLAAIRTASVSATAESSLSPTIPVRRRGGGVEHVGKDVLALTGLLSTQPGFARNRSGQGSAGTRRP